MAEIVVSVVMNAYQHAPYIRSCLESLVAQKTDFAFEILAHDDASTDGTADVIREFEAKYPHLIRPVYQTENQYHSGGIARFQDPRIRGRYAALCEGDDCWTDERKLQKQVTALEARPDIDICACAADRVDGVTGRVLGPMAPAERDTVFSAEQVIDGGGQFVATSSLLYRASLNRAMPPFRQQRRSDYTLQIHGSLRGGMLYLADDMSLYRYRTPGSWSEKYHGDIERKRAFFRRVSEMLGQLDLDTGGRYHDVILGRIAKYERQLLQGEWEDRLHRGDFQALLAEDFREIYRGQPPAIRLGIRACTLWPGLYGAWKHLRSAIGKGGSGR